jgi:quercetin dioxygenase-like cupin family protein
VAIHGHVEDLGEMMRAAGNGVQWTLVEPSDLNANLVHLEVGSTLPEHVNKEVDVLLVVLAGDGILRLDGRPFALSPNVVAHVPKGASRAVEAVGSALSFLSVHGRRGLLQVKSPQRGA